MDKFLSDKLFKKHKEILNLNQNEGRILFKRFGFEVNDGWYDILDNALEEIEKISNLDIKEFSIFQIKEKFAGLRFYVNGNNEEVNRIINDAEFEAYKTCEYCGSKEHVRVQKINDGRWMKTICDTCYNKRNENERTT